MAAWESSPDPGSDPATTPNIDKHLVDNRPADGTAAAATNKAAEDQNKPYLTYKDGKLDVFDGTRKTIFLGVNDDGESIARILKPDAPASVDVDTAEDKDLIFNSEQNVLKVAKIINTEVTITSGLVNAVPIPHGITDFVPVPLAYLDNQPYDYRPLPAPLAVSTGNAGGTIFAAFQTFIDVGVDPTNIYIYIYNPANNQVGNKQKIKIYLLQETVN